MPEALSTVFYCVGAMQSRLSVHLKRILTSHAARDIPVTLRLSYILCLIFVYAKRGSLRAIFDAKFPENGCCVHLGYRPVPAPTQWRH